MDPGNQIRTRQGEHVVVALEVVAVIAEATAAEVLLAELVTLEHGAHRAIQDEDALSGQLLDQRTGVLLAHVSSMLLVTGMQ